MTAEQQENGSGTEAAAQPKKRLWIAAIPLVIFLALAGIFMKQLADGGASSNIPSALIGKQAPEFTLEPVAGLNAADGTTMPGFSRADLEGKVSIVNVWASWCVPCRVEHPVLMELAKRDGLQLAGINYKDKTENALRFLGQLGNPFTRVGIDPRGKAAIDWGVYGVPETFIVGRDGTILHKHVGPLEGERYEKQFLPALEAALAGAPSS